MMCSVCAVVRNGSVARSSDMLSQGCSELWIVRDNVKDIRWCRPVCWLSSLQLPVSSLLRKEP